MHTMLLSLLGSRWPWLLGAALVTGVWVWGTAGHAEAARQKAGFAAYVAEAERRTAAAEREQRELETMRRQAREEVDRANALSRARDREAAMADGAAAGRAAAAADLRVRDAVASAGAGGGRAGQDPGAVARCPAVAAALGDVLRACIAEHRQLGADATDALSEARSRGSKCAAEYDALSPGAAQ